MKMFLLAYLFDFKYVCFFTTIIYKFHCSFQEMSLEIINIMETTYIFGLIVKCLVP